MVKVFRPEKSGKISPNTEVSRLSVTADRLFC